MKNNKPYLITIAFLLSLLFISAIANAQQKYGYISSEVDFRNTILQDGVNETKGYNGTIKLGYKADWFQVEGFGEIYPNIDYTSIGMNIYYVVGHDKALRMPVGVQLSTIDRNSAHTVNGQEIYGKLNASFGFNAGLEYHIGKLFINARWELKHRSDLMTFEEQKDRVKPFMSYMRGSGFVGIGIKI